MNGESEFEKELQRQPQRPLPPAWRAEILSAARQAAPRRQLSPVVPRTLFSTLSAQLSTVLWPHPRAWAGLAAIWLLIFALDFTAHEPSGRKVAGQAGPPSPQMRELLQAQEQLMAELVGPFEPAENRQPKPVPPQPRSECREEFMNA